MTSSDEIIVTKRPWTWVLIGVLLSITVSSVECVLVIAYISGLQQETKEQSEQMQDQSKQLDEQSKRIERIEQLLLAHVKKVDGPTVTASGTGSTAVINAGREQLIREDLEFWRKVRINDNLQRSVSAVEFSSGGFASSAVGVQRGSIGAECSSIKHECGNGPTANQVAADCLHSDDADHERLRLNLVP